jgi:hypothetical protein
MDLREIEWDGVDWIDLAQNRDQWRALVNMLMNLRVHKMLGSSRVAAQLAASEEGLSSMSDDDDDEEEEEEEEKELCFFTNYR